MPAGAVASETIDTSPVPFRVAAEIEAAEARAWADLYAAAPPAFAEQAGVGTSDIGGALVLRWAATGRRYFSRAIGLGVTAPATEARIDEILGVWEAAGISMFLLQSLPHCRPAGYAGRLRARGLEPFDAQDRVVRGGEPLAVAPARVERDLAVERVTRANVDEWVDLLERDYRLSAAPWLQALIGRPGWHNAVAREDGRVVAARGMYVGPDGTAWLGIDGPVPGLRTDDFEPDAALLAFLVAEGLVRGAHRFVTDIEAAAPTMDTPPYATFARLGFRRPYVRTHFARL